MLNNKTIFALLAIVTLTDVYYVYAAPAQPENDLLKEHCRKNGAEHKANDVENSGKSFIQCIKGLVDLEVLTREIEEAILVGDLAEVFAEYCAKSSQLKTCINDWFDGVTPCVDATSQRHITTIKNASDQLVDFVCYNDGIRIALFIADGGPQCFQNKATDIRACGDALKNSIADFYTAQSHTTQERCAKYEEVVSCIVQKLETCETPIPANLFRSIAGFVRNGSPCVICRNLLLVFWHNLDPDLLIVKHFQTTEITKHVIEF